jgi:hypothetical protein
VANFVPTTINLMDDLSFLKHSFFSNPPATKREPRLKIDIKIGNFFVLYAICMTRIGAVERHFLECRARDPSFAQEERRASCGLRVRNDAKPT